MNTQQKKTEKRIRLKGKIRSRISGTASIPRLSVFRSNVHMYAQLIDDTKGVTIGEASDIKETKGTKAEKAVVVGKKIAEIALAKKISAIVFDRNGFKYTGRVKLVADSAREAGLKF